MDLWMLERPSKDDSDRRQWPFTPFEQVGPSRFGMTHDEVVDAKGGTNHRELRHRGGACHLEFAGDGVNAYFDVEAGLACVAVDAFNGPKVFAPGSAVRAVAAPLWGRSQERIRPEHRDRAAVVYVRQSTRQQVVDHFESTRSQYALVEHAVGRGWGAFACRGDR